MDKLNEHLEDALGFLEAGEYKEAEDEYARALAYSVREFGEASSVSARVLGHLSRCVFQQGKLDVAAPMYARLVRCYEGLGGEDEGHRGGMEHADAVLQLAAVLAAQGHAARAQEMREKADKMLEEAKEQMERDEQEQSADEETSSGEEGDEHVEEQKGSGMIGGAQTHSKQKNSSSKIDNGVFRT